MNIMKKEYDTEEEDFAFLDGVNAGIKECIKQFNEIIDSQEKIGLGENSRGTIHEEYIGRLLIDSELFKEKLNNILKRK